MFLSTLVFLQVSLTEEKSDYMYLIPLLRIYDHIFYAELISSWAGINWCEEFKVFGWALIGVK